MNYKEKKREAIIKKLSVSYIHSDKDIYRILKDKGFKINVRTLASQIRYYRWNAIIESLECGEYKINEKAIILMDNYLNYYPDCRRSLAVKNSFS